MDSSSTLENIDEFAIEEKTVKLTVKSEVKKSISFAASGDNFNSHLMKNSSLTESDTSSDGLINKLNQVLFEKGPEKCRQYCISLRTEHPDLGIKLIDHIILDSGSFNFLGVYTISKRSDLLCLYDKSEILHADLLLIKQVDSDRVTDIFVPLFQIFHSQIPGDPSILRIFISEMCPSSVAIC
jgi:hypothetical protein